MRQDDPRETLKEDPVRSDIRLRHQQILGAGEKDSPRLKALAELIVELLGEDMVREILEEREKLITLGIPLGRLIRDEPNERNLEGEEDQHTVKVVQEADQVDQEVARGWFKEGKEEEKEDDQYTIDQAEEDRDGGSRLG